MARSKDEFLNYLNALAEYTEEGIRDYISDNSIEDFLDVGQGMAEIERLVAITRLREFVQTDEFPWFESFWPDRPS